MGTPSSPARELGVAPGFVRGRALLRCWITVRGPAGLAETRGSNHLRQLVEGRCNCEPGQGVDSQFVVTSPQILDERVTSHDNAGGPVQFQSAHRSQPGLQATMVGFQDS